MSHRTVPENVLDVLPVSSDEVLHLCHSGQANFSGERQRERRKEGKDILGE